MKEVSLVKPDMIASGQVLGHGLTYLPCAKRISRFPLPSNPIVMAEPFDLALIGRLKYPLPTHVHARLIIPGVHDTLLCKFLLNGRIYPLSNLHAVGQGSLTSCFSRLETEEHQTQRPTPLI